VTGSTTATPRAGPAGAAPGLGAVVLAGGLGRRLDGADKPALEIGGVALLDRVLAACAAAREVVCVGPRRDTRRPVRWTREDPPGSGPVAALGAGLAHLATDPGEAVDRVAVLAADLPFLDADIVHSLWTAAAGHEGAVLVDDEGRAQWLAACYDRERLVARIARHTAENGGTAAGLSLRRLLSGADLVRVPDPGRGSVDCDTWEDVEHVRRLVERGGGGHRPSGTESER
jgi:molybdopterin-guanine dinucleotide biosynthesis protein A